MFMTVMMMMMLMVVMMMVVAMMMLIMMFWQMPASCNVNSHRQTILPLSLQKTGIRNEPREFELKPSVFLHTAPRQGGPG